MASRLKEDERNERAIRNLLKLPENRRCINCNSLGPQYVCTSFWTFVCTTCSGIHREFTHRVKSVSMAKFTPQEVSALQGGGNASAREIYFKEWDPKRQSFPDSSNIERLRDFIKHVYVDKRYTGAKSYDKPLQMKMGEAEDSYQGGSRSPPSKNECHYTERPSPGGRSDGRSSKNSYQDIRSPGYDQDFRGSPVAARTNVVNDWRREDRFGDGKKSEGRSPDHQRDSDISSPSIVRPVRDILGEKAPTLRVIEPPKNIGHRPADGSLRTQRTASSSSLASSNGNPPELKTESSLIDFDSAPEPPSITAAPQVQQNTLHASSVTQPTPLSNNNWASFDSVQEVKSSQAPSNANLLDVLSELSVGPIGNSQSPFGTTAPVATPISRPGGSQAATSGPSVSQWQNVHPQQNLLSAQSFNQAVGGSVNNQPGNPSLAGNAQMLSSSQVTQGVDVKLTAKRELPADLFTSNYSSFAAPGQGWYPAPQYGMGFNMQYNVPAPMPPAFQQPSKSSNPFDVNESSRVQVTTFPSMAPLQGALPNMVPPSGIQRTLSLGTPFTEWSTTQSSHPIPSNIHRTSSLGIFPPQGPSYGSPISSGPFMGQTPPNMPPPPRSLAGGFGSFNTNKQQSGLHSASNSFSSVGGNPFG